MLLLVRDQAIKISSIAKNFANSLSSGGFVNGKLFNVSALFVMTVNCLDLSCNQYVMDEMLVYLTKQK